MIAMQEEIKLLHKNKTWKLILLSHRRKAINLKWIYKIKRDGNDKVEQCHTRLVVKRYSHEEDIDLNEIFSHVVRFNIIRVILNLCATFNLYLE